MFSQNFEERQYFRQWWLWALLLAMVLFFLAGLILQVYFKKPIGDKPMSDQALFWLTFGVILFVYLFSKLNLHTEVSGEGIRVGFPPLFRRTIRWDEISRAYIRKYNSLLEFGGWGIRFGWGSSAYNVSGNMGLQLELKNGRKLLIGTRMPVELEEAVRKRLSPENK